MKLRYYAPIDLAEVDHRHAMDLLERIHEQHGIPVEAIYVAPGEDPPDSFPGPVDEQDREEVYRRDFTYNSTLQDALGGRPSDLFKRHGKVEIAGNVRIVDDGDLLWATQFPGTHHGWGSVDPGDTSIGFLEDVENRGLTAITERAPTGRRPDNGWDLDEDGETAENGADISDDPSNSPESATATPDLAPTRDAIRAICTGQSFQRGIEYYEDGRVRNLHLAGTDVTATVLGTHEYQVELDLGVDGFDTWCTCP